MKRRNSLFVIAVLWALCAASLTAQPLASPLARDNAVEYKPQPRLRDLHLPRTVRIPILHAPMPTNGIRVLQAGRDLSTIAQWMEAVYPGTSYMIGVYNGPYEYCLAIGSNYSGVSSQDIFLFGKAWTTHANLADPLPWKLIYGKAQAIKKVERPSEYPVGAFYDSDRRVVVLITKTGKHLLEIPVRNIAPLLRED